MALPEEYEVIRKAGFSKPNIAYFISRSALQGTNHTSPAYLIATRFGSLGCCLSTTIFRSTAYHMVVQLTDWQRTTVAPIDNCDTLRYMQGIFFEIGGPATSFLFFVRVRAIYNNSKIVTTFFGVLWLSIAGLGLLLIFGITGREYQIVVLRYHPCDNILVDRIPYTRRCAEGNSNFAFSAVPVILTAVFDTLVFLAISYKMVSISMAGNNWSAQVRSFFRGDGLHHLSKSLLRSGQAYYLWVFCCVIVEWKSNTPISVTIGVAITSIALILSPGITGEMHVLLSSAYFALASAMACRVFRAVLLGFVKDTHESTCRMSSAFRMADSYPHGDDATTTSKNTKPSLASDVVINMGIKLGTTTESSDENTILE